MDYTYFDYEPGSLPGTITVNNSTGRAIDPWGHQDTLRGIEEFDFSDLSQVRFAGSAAGIPSNLVQAGFGVAVSVFLAAALRKSGYVRSKFSNL